MRIWIFNHYAVGPNSSGITRHYDLAKELVKLGHEVTIFASSFNHQKRQEEEQYLNWENYVEKSYEGVKFCWIKTPSYKKNDLNRIKNMLAYTLRLNKIVKKQAYKPDVIIGSLMHPLAALMGYKVSKSTSSKFYFEERDLWPQSLIDLGKVSPRNPLVKILGAMELFLYKKADKIIVLFDKAPNYVMGRGIDSGKIIYLPNGVDIKRYKEQEKNSDYEFENFFKENKEKFIVVYTGAHSVANYLESVLEIAKEVKDEKNIHFLLIGDGPDKENLMKLAKTYNLKNVTFLPAVQKEKIPSILKQSDAGIIALRDAPVYKWGISLNKMYDYMAAGLPIVMYTTLKDTVVEREKFGVVCDDLNSIAEELRLLSENFESKAEMKINSIKYVSENHSWEELAKRLHGHLIKEKVNK